MEGWIKIYRQLSENPLWTSEPFSRGQAWIDLILLANHKDGYFYKRGNKINLTRGQLGWSELALSERWKWSRSKVRKFLNDLEKEQQIEQQKSTVTQIVTIKNYDKFQEKEQRKNNRKTAERQQKDTYKNDNNEKKEKNIYRAFDHLSISIDDFNTLNNQYTKGQIDEILDDIENFNGNTRYKSLKITARNWLKRKYPEQETKEDKTKNFINNL